MAYSDAELIEDVCAVADAVERSPSLQDYRDHGEYAATTLYRRFGSWQDAVARAGFEPRDPETRIPTEELINALQELGDEVGGPPTTTQMIECGRYWSKVYRDRFGSWSEALEAAGFDPDAIDTQHDRVSREELLDELERLAEKRGGTPSSAQMAREGAHAVNTYRQEFGSWNAAVEAIGCEPRDRGLVTDAELVEDLERLTEEFDARPTSNDVTEHSEHSIATYQRHFGSWSAALDVALE